MRGYEKLKAQTAFFKAYIKVDMIYAPEFLFLPVNSVVLKLFAMRRI